MAKAKKVPVVDGPAEKGAIDIKKGKNVRLVKDRGEEVKDGVKKLYDDKVFDHIEKPVAGRGGLVGLAIVLSIIFGLISGTIGSLFILTRQTIKMPYLKELDLTRFFPTREITLVTEKKVTVTIDLRLAWLAKDLSKKIVRIFSVKPIPEEGRLQFLEQIYAPWQTKSLATIITNDGWLISSGNFEKEKEYMALNEENEIFPVQVVARDSLTGISFLKIEGQNLSVVKFASVNEVTQGQGVVILDGFKNLHFTEISRPAARDIYKSEDLIRSTDKFSEFLQLDAETSLSAFSNAPIFGLDGAVVGLISNDKIIPSWQFKNLIARVLKEQKITRSYLGIDYLRIEEAPGLTSPLFKDLTNGAIVFGQPVKDSPAAKAGIQNADVVVKVDGLSLNTDRNLTYLVQEKAPGQEMDLTVLRAGEEMKIKIKLVGISKSQPLVD